MQPRDPHRARPARSAWGRALWAALGVACVGVGLVGIVLPGLPTTPFLILAAACFLRSSQKLYDRVLGHPRFGPLVRDYREGRGLPLRVKAWALSLMWIFVLFALIWGLPAGNWWLRAIVGVAALIGTVYLIQLPTRRVDPARQFGHGSSDNDEDLADRTAPRRDA
jgi:uncharacterized membrane protein YbaN (DUF454 family)